MNYLTELETQSSAIRPISVREFVENPLQPPFPFPFHGKRDSEPRYPRAIKSSMGQGELAEAGRESVEWNKWSQSQPDHSLLSYERGLFENLQRTQIPLKQTELDDIHQKWVSEATRLTNSGYTDIVEKYWPHLTSSPTVE